MVPALFVMLLFVGDFRGGPATIPGFHTMDACHDAIPTVLKGYDSLRPNGSDVRANCVELRAE